MLLEANQRNFTKTMTLMEEYSKNTGLIINYNKTQILRLGSLRNSCAKFYSERQLQWSECVKILGVKVYADIKTTMDVNYNDLMDKIGQNYVSLDQ